MRRKSRIEFCKRADARSAGDWKLFSKAKQLEIWVYMVGWRDGLDGFGRGGKRLGMIRKHSIAGKQAAAVHG